MERCQHIPVGDKRPFMCWGNLHYPRLAAFIIAIVFGGFDEIRAQAPDTSAVIHGAGTRGPYQLGFRNLISGSAAIYRDEIEMHSEDFSVQYANGIISLAQPLAIGDSLVIKFKYIPLELKPRYFLHSLDSDAKTILTEPVESEKFRGFDSDLKVTGSKGFSVQSGGGAPDGLSQSLNLSIAGELLPGLRTSANISDKSSAATGTTRRLDELDKIYIEAESDRFKGTFGDFDIAQTRDPLLSYQRKLTGLNARYTDHGSAVTGSAAFFPGEYRSIVINGRDGQLGPYYLTDIGGRQGAQVLAGSERIYIDGILQSRGPRNDYEIDYETGTLQFSPSKAIRDETRITIDYEIARDEYSRNLYSVSGEKSELFGLSFFSTLLQEGDNRNSPKSFEMTSEAREILGQAGADRLRAARSGAQYAGPDSGDYNLDTAGVAHYVYAGANSGSYDVTFSFIGAGLGSYQSLGAGVYQFVGLRLGEYEPIILIPLPETKRYGSLGFEYRLADTTLTLRGEVAGSSYDRNTSSSLDRSRGDLSLLGEAGYKRNVLGGFVALNALGRGIGNNAIFPGRINDIERYRKYDLESQDSANGERLQEIGITTGIDNSRQIKFELGALTQPGITKRERQAATAQWRLFSPLNMLSSVERTHGDRVWWKSTNLLGAAFERLQPSLGMNFERRDGVSGFKYYEYSAQLPVNYTSNFSGATEATIRDEKYLDNGWRDKFISGSIQQRISILIPGSGLSGDAAITYYKKEYKDFTGTNTEQRTGTARLSYSDPTGRGSLIINERLGSSNERLQSKSYFFVGDGKGQYRLEDGEYIQDSQGDYVQIIEELGDGSRISEIGTEIDASLSPFMFLAKPQTLEENTGRLNIETSLDYSLRKTSDRLEAGDFVPWNLTNISNIAYQNGDFNLRAYYYAPAGNHRVKYSFIRTFESGARYTNEDNDNTSRTDEVSWSFPIHKNMDIILSGLMSQTKHSVNTLKYTIDRKNAGALANYRFARQWILSGGISFEQARQSDTDLRATMPAAELGLARDLEKSGKISTRFIYTRLDAAPKNIYVPYQVASGKGNGDNFEANISARMAVTKNGRFDLSYRYEGYAHRPSRNNLRLEFLVLFL